MPSLPASGPRCRARPANTNTPPRSALMAILGGLSKSDKPRKFAIAEFGAGLRAFANTTTTHLGVREGQDATRRLRRINALRRRTNDWRDSPPSCGPPDRNADQRSAFPYQGRRDAQP